MKIVHEPLRYAHDEGHTDVCYSTDGENFITCGADGDIRIWSVDETEDPNHTCIGEWALSVRQKDDKIYVATGNNEIQILSHPEGKRDGILIRSTDPFNQIALCKSQNIAVLGGEGMEVLIMDLDTCTVKTSFKDLGGPCLSVAISPNGNKVAAATGDGKLLIWDLETKLILKEESCFPKVNSFANAKNLCRLDFDPDNNTLAYPEKNTVKLLNLSTWTSETLDCKEVKCDYSVLQYSPCGKYLVGATLEGDFVIWETENNKVFKISKHDSSKAVCGLMWNPKGNGEIVYTDIEGQLSIMSYCSKWENVDKPVDEEKPTEDGFTENEVDFGDLIEEDENSEIADLKSLDRAESPDRVTSRASTSRPLTPPIPLQPAFMPTSTPDHLDPRYLCWNNVGIVKSYGNNSGDELNSKSIEVEFHESAFHNSMMLENFQEYSMGSISKGALVLANSSQIMVIPLVESNKSWTLKVEEYTEIVLVAVSECLVCFATSDYKIRISSVCGTQTGIISISGPLVCMSAYQNVLLVAYHCASIRNGDQCINIKLFKFEGYGVESHDLGSALGPESTLSWLGFSDVGTPSMMDSLGTLSLFPPKCNTWIPFCDTKKHCKSPGDTFFVTTVFESYQAIGGIRCKGTVYPGFVPRPTICELPLEPPFAESSTEKTQMEMSMFTWSNLNVIDTDRKYKETALKLFALACKNDLDHRAFEFMQIIENQQVLNLGLKYATKLNKRRLAEKLMELASKLQADNSQEAEPSRIFHSVSSEPVLEETAIKPRPGKISLSKLTPRNKKVKQDDSQMDNNEFANENSLSVINTQESLFTDGQSFTEETPKKNPFLIKPQQISNDESDSVTSLTPRVNPFLRKAKKQDNIESSPLSLTDKYAGINYKVPNTKKPETGEKRKLADGDLQKPVEKQRKLDKFMFSKH